MDAKHAAETEPTYPNPKMLTDKPKRILLRIEDLGAQQRLGMIPTPVLNSSKPVATGAPVRIQAD
jgi:hypothetical protein